MSNKNDKQIASLQKMVDAKKNELGSCPATSSKTNNVFKGVGGPVNLNVADQATLVLVLGQLITMRDAENKAAAMLGISNHDWKFGGYTFAEWHEDIRSRNDRLTWNAKNTELEKMKKQLAQLLSEDARTANDLADITSKLNGLG